jgi:DNA-binding transcriptional ArsR family regulator
MLSGSVGMAEVAALVGDTARAQMLDALVDGRALTAGELAYTARVSPPTASAHLAKLLDGGLITVIKQGRHRYYRLASASVGRMLESIMLVAAMDSPPRYRPRSAREEALRYARSCYDHLAGQLGVAIADALVRREHVSLGDDGGTVTPSGAALMRGLGIDMAEPQRGRVFCRPCLDWTERRPHLAGVLGARLLCRCFELGWIERGRDSRAIKVTPRGRDGLQEQLGVELPAPPKARAV